jgi:outer membrane protein TolC
LRLTVANRFGNPTLGPAYTLDNTSVSNVGAQLNFPLPVFNVHRGEIAQAQAQVGRAVLDLRNAEVVVRQDVRAALTRLTAARDRVEVYRSQLLPDLRNALEGIQRLFLSGEQGVDILRVIDVRRKLIRAQEGYLDAQWELSQAQADLAAAVGDPTLASCGPGAPPPDGAVTPP